MNAPEDTRAGDPDSKADTADETERDEPGEEWDFPTRDPEEVSKGDN